MDIQIAIGIATEALDMFETRLKFIDCYEQVVGHAAEAIKKAAEDAGLSFSYPPGTYTGE